MPPYYWGSYKKMKEKLSVEDPSAITELDGCQLEDCFDCDNESCIFHSDGECHFHWLFGKNPRLEGQNGCDGWVEKPADYKY